MVLYQENGREKMNEEKRNRLIAAVVVNVILLIVILAAVVIYQLAVIVRLNGLEKDLKNKIDYFNTQTELDEKTLEYYQSYDGLPDKAYEYGFVFGK